MKIVLVGGGTGGHFYPLMAVAEAVITRSINEGLPLPQLYYMGPEPYDQAALDQHGIVYSYCPAGKVRRYRSAANITDRFKMLYGIVVATWKLFWLYPDVIMSKGGYTSVPVIVAAALLRIPSVIHESDAKPGRANLLAARFARHIAISYPDAGQYFPKEKIALTGIPLPSATLTKVEQPAITRDRPLVFVTGGSMGAKRVNDFILAALPELLTRYDVIHQTGRELFTEVQNTANALVTDSSVIGHYHPVPFLSTPEFSAALLESSVVIARAGSTTIANIALFGKPAILVPIPEEISQDQRSNAYAYARFGAATVMEEANLTPHLLIAEIDRIVSDASVQEKMKDGAKHFIFPQASDTIARALLTIGIEHGS
jgi:UDP-N-acetylglucosamine--N-acetylmuramyl-(pentapeptide) pyrophosphoryl-undecaprenol N-acetylglucosamine transferase